MCIVLVWYVCVNNILCRIYLFIHSVMRDIIRVKIIWFFLWFWQCVGANIIWRYTELIFIVWNNITVYTECKTECWNINMNQYCSPKMFLSPSVIKLNPIKLINCSNTNNVVQTNDHKAFASADKPKHPPLIIIQILVWFFVIITRARSQIISKNIIISSLIKKWYWLQIINRNSEANTHTLCFTHTRKHTHKTNNKQHLLWIHLPFAFYKFIKQNEGRTSQKSIQVIVVPTAKMMKTWCRHGVLYIIMLQYTF